MKKKNNEISTKSSQYIRQAEKLDYDTFELKIMYLIGLAGTHVF